MHLHQTSHREWLVCTVPAGYGMDALCRARRLTDEQRSSVANYLTVYKGQEGGIAKLALMQNDHPSITRAHELLKPAWVQAG